LALIKIKQINNAPAATGGIVVYDGTNNVWSNNDDGAVQVSAGTTGQRPTGNNGLVRYNDTLNCLEAYVNGSWICLFGAATQLQLLSITGADSQDSELMPFFEDDTRGNKLLSVESNTFRWSETTIGNNDWVALGDASDANSGYIVPYDGTIVRATAHCADANGNTKPLDLYIGNSNTVGAGTTILTLSGAAETTDENTDLNIDVSAGDKIRLRGGSGGTIQDTAATVWIKWRSA
jgi:hypothetical protein